jgi:hypothetical protein
MYVFAGETGQPLWRSSLLEGLHQGQVGTDRSGWVNFQVFRRTHASRGHKAKVDPKVSADQRGHGIGVALDVYTKSSMKDRATASKQLEDSVLTHQGYSGAKEVRMTLNGGLWRVRFEVSVSY